MKNFVPVNLLSLIFYVLISIDGSESAWTVLMNEDGTVEIVDLDATPEESASTLEELKEGVLFYLFTDSNPEDGQQIYLDDDETLAASFFNASNPTRILIHGWQGSVTGLYANVTKEAYLSVGGYNVIVVDWSKWAQKNYLVARSKIVAVGEYVGLFIDYLVYHGVDAASDLVIVGHSLGAHISGVAGRSAKCEVGVIIAVDPAGPLFYVVDLYARLRSTDANFVQVIHTSAGFLGHTSNLGDVDIWVNGGSAQSGCGVDIFRTCAHKRGYYYLAESLTNAETQFSALSCDSYANYLSGNCDSNNSTYLGSTSLDRTASPGIYHVKTNSASTYAMG